MHDRNLNVLLGLAFWGLIVGVSLNYELRHHAWFQATASVVLAALLLYVAFSSIVPIWKGRDDEKIRYLVGAPEVKRRFGTIVLIALCVIASVLAWAAPDGWYIREGTVGSNEVLGHHEWWRIVVSAFLHATPMHLWMNMVALWFLGSELETMLGTSRMLVIYIAAAVGGGLAVVAAGQEHTLGASGAIYGLMGAAAFFGWNAWRHGFQQTARRLLIGSGLLIGLNLLFSVAIPNISLAGHLGGLVTGFAVAMFVGIPQKMKEAWAISDRLPKWAHCTYDANGTMYYNGPARFAVQSQWVLETDLATAVEKDVVPQYLFIRDADLDQIVISCPIPSERVLSSILLSVS